MRYFDSADWFFTALVIMALVTFIKIIFWP